MKNGSTWNRYPGSSRAELTRALQVIATDGRRQLDTLEKEGRTFDLQSYGETPSKVC